MDRGNRHWAMMLSGHLPTIEGVEDSPNFVVNLANRWKLASDIYAQNTDNMILVKYEDFKKDKEGEIAALANSLGMAGMDPIAQHVDIQYQPKGKVDVDILQFFGRENLNAIENICGAHMRHFGYV